MDASEFEGKARVELLLYCCAGNMDGDDEESKAMGAVDLSEQALEISFHPHRDVIASGLVDGKVCL